MSVHGVALKALLCVITVCLVATTGSCTILTKGKQVFEGIAWRVGDILCLLSCCKELVDVTIRKKQAELDSDHNYELRELEKIKVIAASAPICPQYGPDQPGFVCERVRGRTGRKLTHTRESGRNLNRQNIFASS